MQRDLLDQYGQPGGSNIPRSAAASMAVSVSNGIYGQGATAGAPMQQQPMAGGWQAAMTGATPAGAAAVDPQVAAWNAMTPQQQQEAYAKFNATSGAAAGTGGEPAAKKAKVAGAPIEVGEKLPAGELKTRNAEGVVETVDPATLFAGKKAVLFGVPGAFSSDGADHLPGYVVSCCSCRCCFSRCRYFRCCSWGSCS